MRTRSVEPQEWWRSLSDGERRLICCVMKMLRGAKRSQIRDVARAAVKWERGIGCYIKVRLIGENQRAERRKQKWKRQSVDSGWLRVEGRGEKQKSGKLTRLRVASARQEVKRERRRAKAEKLKLRKLK